ncbi:MAG: sodium:proton antiporter [Peptostreptococcus sp.]|uniref:cation:proton antiporter n=1 Tax=Peptostreptococcus sp. TaxID=1262 RepID=UPI001CB1BAA8|nr:sodium:proton antiporter [Peptostreptococcus sp.]MBF1057076.1 sodium:proton antiporter [Peptostreptococcus sp.]
MKISATLAVSLIIFLGVFSQWLAWKISKPAIVIMSLAGLIVGPFLNIIVPSQVLGDSIYKSIISISVALILFEGSLSLDFKEITDTKMTIKRIVVFGALISWILGSLSAYFLAGLSITTSLVIGALLIVTGPTVIIALLRQAKLDSKVSTILKWEGILVDPMGAILAVLSFEAAEVFASSSVSPGILVKFGIGVLIAVAIGVLVGIGTGRALQKNYFPEYLKSAIVLCLVLGTFSLSESITHETGLLAVTVMGVILANMHISSIEQVKHFNENISILLTSSVFVMLTSSLSRSILVDIFQLKIILFVLSMLFIVRPLSIWLSTIGTDLNIREKTLIGWIAPRGIVALTVTGYFSNLLVEEGHQDAELLLALTFALVIVTVIAHGFSIQPLAKKLGLAHDGKPGLVIVGSNPFSVALAKFLKDWDVPSLIVDYSGKNLENVINTDIETYQGEILYEVANYNLDLVIYKKMLLNTPIPLYNILVSNEFVSRFEHTSSICIINVLGDKVRSDFKELQKIGVPRLGDYRATYLSLIRLVEDGYDFAATQITEELTEEEYYRLMDYRRINIFTMTESGDIEFFTTEHKPRISSGDYIVSLTPPSPDDTGQHLEFTTSRADFNTIQNS